MPRRIWHKAGKFGIIDSEVPAALDDPNAYLSSVYLHGDLDYLKVVYDQTQSIAFPARSTGSNTGIFHATYAMPNHNLGKRVRGVVRIGNTQYPANALVTYSGGDKFRFIRAEIGLNTVTIRETTLINGSLAAATYAVRVILYDVAPVTYTTKLYHFIPSQGRLIAAQGKFDTSNKYLRENRTATPDFWMTSGRTVDSNGRNFTQVLPNGEAVGYGSLSFAGTGFFGASD